MTSLFWLASYPKSGSTWFRALLAQLLLPQRASHVQGLALLATPLAADRWAFDQLLGLKSSNLPDAQVAELRPLVGEAMGQKAKGPQFLKIHDAYRGPTGAPIVSARATRGVIYVVRNPLDVCVSFACHMDVDPDRAVEVMCDSRHRIADKPGTVLSQLPQLISDWSTHVLGWLEADQLRVHVVRYEDLLDDPVPTLGAAARFLSLECDEAGLGLAVEAASFEALQREEREHGFREKPRGMQAFFRKGKAGGWREALTREQAERLLDAHGDVMRRLGYETDGLWG